jgi:hypothetical protein
MVEPIVFASREPNTAPALARPWRSRSRTRPTTRSCGPSSTLFLPPKRRSACSRAGAADGDCQAQRRHEWHRRPTRRWHFLLVGRNRRLTKDFENLAGTLDRDLRYPRRHSARHQAAGQGVGFESGSGSYRLLKHTPPYRRGRRQRYSGAGAGHVSGRTARALTTTGGSSHGELQGHIIGQSRV